MLSNLNGAADALIGGWGFDGIATFQEGYPLGLSDLHERPFDLCVRRNAKAIVVPGCNKKVSGSMADRLGPASGETQTYFNTSCFLSQTVSSSSVFNPFAFGNESRTDNALRTPGVANWDMSIFKDIPIQEKVTFDFRVEAFNLFNRVQFGQPASLAVGNTSFGSITSQYNNPRILQASGRISF